MKNIQGLTKEYLKNLIEKNPSAALEYIWEIRKTLDSCNRKRMQLDGALRSFRAAVKPIRDGQRGGNVFAKLSDVDDLATEILDGKKE